MTVARTTLGYAILGGVLALVFHPFLLAYLFRSRIATPRDPFWTLLFFLLLLVPIALFALIGRSSAGKIPQ